MRKQKTQKQKYLYITKYTERKEIRQKVCEQKKQRKTKKCDYQLHKEKSYPSSSDERIPKGDILFSNRAQDNTNPAPNFSMFYCPMGRFLDVV